MGCGVSHFEHKEPEMDSDQQNPNNLHDEQPDNTNANRIPLLSNSVHYYSENNDNYNTDDEVDDDGDEYRSQNLEEKDYYDLNRELQNINSLKFPGSPSFREYCGFDHDQYSNGIDEGANDRTRFVEEPPEMEKEGSSDQISVVKKVSRVRRIRSAISRRMLARKFLLNSSCYNKTTTPNKYYTSSFSNHSKLVSAKP